MNPRSCSPDSSYRSAPRSAFAGLLLACALASCINDDLYLYEVELEGSVAAPDPLPAGELHVEVHHATSTGPISHPLGVIDEFVVDQPSASFERTVLVPREAGEGLVVYAWLDLDGDGELCALGGSADEPAGLLELDAFPEHALSFALELDASCLGPERLYP